MSKKLLFLPILTAISLLSNGCGTQKDIAAAAIAVEQFHHQLDAQDYLSVYNNADQRFRDASKQADFVALMTAIHTKLGIVQQASQRNFYVNYGTSGSNIRLTYATIFSGGDAEEQFVWSKRGDNLQLLGYHINSNALITK